MPVYKFSHLLAVLVHLAHTVAKWKTNFLILDVGDKLVNTDDTALMKYEKKFMQKAVCIMYTVFCSLYMFFTLMAYSVTACSDFRNKQRNHYSQMTDNQYEQNARFH